MNKLSLPNFLYMGTARAGSTYLYQVLEKHPDIFTPKTKDIYFFNHNYQRGIEWYSSFFEGSENYKAAGEYTMDYFAYPEVLQRIKNDIPEIKLIFCLREPISRLFSNFYWEQLVFDSFSSRDFRKGLSLFDFGQHPDIFKLGNYYENILPYYENFPKDQIKVFFFEELMGDKVQGLTEILEFIGADSTQLPANINERINELRVARYPLIAEMGYHIVKFMRKIGNPEVSSGLRDSPLFNKIMFREPIKDKRIVQQDFEKVWQSYRRNDYKLSQLIGRDLPESWSQSSVKNKYEVE